MAINLNLGNTEVIKDLGKKIQGNAQNITYAGTWMNNQSYPITLAKGIYVVQGNITVQYNGSGEVIIVCDNVITHTNHQMIVGYGGPFNNQPIPFCCVIDVGTDITSLPYRLWAAVAADTPCILYMSFVKIA